MVKRTHRIVVDYEGEKNPIISHNTEDNIREN